MRSLSSTLLAAQLKATRKPVLKVEVQAYGHPAKADAIQWQVFGWQKLHGDSTTQNHHGVALPSDGSLDRIRLSNTTIYHQRVTDPGPSSDYSNWTNLGNTIADSHLAIAAQGTEVIVAAAGASSLYRRESSDSGATWGSWVNMNNTRPCERGCAVAFKPNGDCAIVHASDVNDPTSLYIQTRTSGNWSTGLGQRGGDWEMEGLAMYYDGDWNIIALVIDGNYLSVVRMIYGDGDQVSAGTWGTDQKIGLGRARLDIAAQIAMRRFETGWSWTTRGRARYQPTYWEKRQAVIEALAGESLDVGGAFLTLPSSYPALLSLARENQPWLFRLKPGSEFIDYNWNKASNINTVAPYGLAIDTDATYIYATQANEVWRTAIPSSWEPPTQGDGPGSKTTITSSHILGVTERIEPEQPSELEVELDNSAGTYNSPGSGALANLKRGSRVNLHLGYRTSQDETSEVGRYFIEAWEYNRSPGQATFTVNCTDAWGLLQSFRFNKPVEWNVSSDDYTVYDLVELVMQAVGGTLSYKSRSSLITSLYPKLEVHAGESSASVISRLLALVPDVIYFWGLDAYIVHPQAADTPEYEYEFPKGAA